MGSSDTLRSVIDAGRSSKRLDELSSARVIGKIAMQIHAAQHKAGSGKAVGPVTPANIKLSPSGEAQLELGEVSSLGYSSPEQTMGGFGDRRSDVFSLGTVLWEVLTHQRLFDAMNDAAVRMAVQEREIQPPSEVNANVPAELSAICMRALNRNASDRFSSLKVMAVEIEEFLDEAGYADDDSKIASYLATMNEAPKQVKIEMPPLARPASSTQPPPVSETATTQPIAKPAAAAPDKPSGGTQPRPIVDRQPAAPAMLGEPPAQPALDEPRSKRPSGAALAAALANASTPVGSNGAAASVQPTGGLPAAGLASTAIGVPKLDEWQDSAAPAAAPPPAAAPVVAESQNAPLTPLPPVLPSGSTPMRADKSTISVSVPPQVKVATVEAKHVESKQPALIVEDKPPAQIVDDGKATLVDGRPPEIVVPKLVDGKLPESALPKVTPSPAAEVKPAAKTETKPSKAETKAAKKAAARAGSEPARKRPPSHADKTPHPASAVSLGPGPRDSKDVLAGWGWGTDKHEALAPEDYDDDYDHHEPNSRKMLVKIIGAGMGVVALIIIMAFAFGGSSSKKKATTAAKQPDVTPPTVVDLPPPPPPEQLQPAAPEAQPAVTGSADVAVAQPAPPPEPTEAEKAEAAKVEAARIETEKAAAAKVEADRLAAEQEQAKQAELAKAETAKQEAARIAAEKAEAKKAQVAATETKKQEAARIAAEKKQEAARVAAEKKQEATRIAAEKAEARKAEQARLAEARKAEAAKKAAAAKTAPKTAKTEPKRPPKAETRVAKAEPKTETKADGKLDTETAYRVGLQQFARGDTSGALASLRTSLAGNPNYAPTWRGLGMVFEKMGEKDQARAAYKRYLQLAPTASDAEQIRGRLERLGT